MCFIRKALDWVFTQTELKWLDDIMPEVHRREKEDITKQQEEQDKEEVRNGEIIFPWGSQQDHRHTQL